MKIKITTGWNGLKGTADCRAAKRTFHAEGRTQAEALSRLCADLAKVPELKGQEWTAPGCGMGGVVGNVIRKGRTRVRVSEMEGFQLHGGKMNEPRT